MAGRLGISYENPPVIGGSAQLYKYEPFLYQYYTIVPGDTIQIVPTPEVIPYATTTATAATYGSSNGYGISYPNSFPFTVQVLSGSNVVESRSFNVYVGNGRFFPPASNSVYTFYRNEPVSVTYGAPIELDTSAAMTSVFTSPSLPVGLTVTPGDASGNKFLLGGTPGVQIPAANYQFIGKNTVNGRVVTTTLNLAVNAERVKVDVSGATDITGMLVGTPIAPSVVTSRYPAFYGTQFRYEWNSNSLPSGIRFADSNNVPVNSPFYPADTSSTILLRGTPTLAAATTLASLGVSNYTTNLTARAIGGPSNVTPFTFSFGETVLFTTTPTVRTLYVGEVINGVDNIRFAAKTYFSSNVGISNIFSPDLRADLSLAYSGSQAYLFSTPTTVAYASSDVFTIRAVNSNGTTRDMPLAITSLPDVVTFDSPTPSNGTTYRFVVSRPLSSAFASNSNYLPSPEYPSPIQFKATAKATTTINDVVYSVTGIGGTGLFVDVCANNNYLTLRGTPVVSSGLAAMIVTASNTNTGATASTVLNYEILPDAITVLQSAPSLPTQFLQNQPMEVVKVTANTLSGRNIVSWQATGFPPGITMSPVGIIQGTPTGPPPGLPQYQLTASTGYSQLFAGLFPYTYQPDFIVFTTPQIRYYVPPRGEVPPIQYTAITYSGVNVSNFYIDLSYSETPTTFGVTLDSNGLFGGIMTTSLPPRPILPPNPVPFYVNAEAVNISGTTRFFVGAENPYALRSFAILQTQQNLTGQSNAVFYSDVILSNTDVPAYMVADDYRVWKRINVDVPYTAWFSDIAIRTETTNIGFLSNVTIVALANDVSTGYVVRSTDGVNFTATTLPPGVILTSVLYSTVTGTWYAGGVQSNDPTKVYLFRSEDNGITWPTSNASLVNDGSQQLGTRIGTGSAFEAYGTRVLEELSFFEGKYILSIMGGSNYNGTTETTRAFTTDYGNTWNTGTGGFALLGMTTETNGSFYRGDDFVAYGSDYYRTGSTDVSSTYQVNTIYSSYLPFGIPVPVIFQFNIMCYDIQQFPNFWLALGVHYYPGFGFRQEVRYAPPGTYGWQGPWFPLTFSNLQFPYSATRPKPPLGLGPIWSDGVNVRIPVERFGVDEVYTHSLADADISNNWTVTSNVYFDLGGATPEIVKVTSPIRISTGPIQPYIDFTNGTPGTPYPTPTFTSPAQTKVDWYQYVPIEPIQISAIPGMGGGPVYLIIQDADVPAGMKFDPFTGILSGTPFQLFDRREIPVYAYDDTYSTYTRIVLVASSSVPRVIRHQSGAGAYTSLLRQYTEVNAAQNARDNRVLPSETQTLGEFMAPPAPDVTTQTVDPRCFDPNVCGEPIVPGSSNVVWGWYAEAPYTTATDNGNGYWRLTGPATEISNDTLAYIFARFTSPGSFTYSYKWDTNLRDLNWVFEAKTSNDPSYPINVNVSNSRITQLYAQSGTRTVSYNANEWVVLGMHADAGGYQNVLDLSGLPIAFPRPPFAPASQPLTWLSVATGDGAVTITPSQSKRILGCRNPTVLGPGWAYAYAFFSNTGSFTFNYTFLSLFGPINPAIERGFYQVTQLDPSNPANVDFSANTITTTTGFTDFFADVSFASNSYVVIGTFTVDGAQSIPARLSANVPRYI